MSNQATVAVLAIGAIIISALAVIALVNPTPRLVELNGCVGPVFVNPGEVAAVFQPSGQVGVFLRGNNEPIPVCEKGNVVAEKLGRVRRLHD